MDCCGQTLPRPAPFSFDPALMLQPTLASACRSVRQRIIQYDEAAIAAAAGMVMIHAQTIRRVTPHFTAVTRRVAPTPMMAPVIVCVVLTGIPPQAAPM